MDTVEQQPCNSNVDNELENRHNDNSFLSELISTVQNYPAVWDIATRVIEVYIRKNRHGKI